MEYFIMDEVAGNPYIPYIGDLPEELDMIDVAIGKKVDINDVPIQLPVSIGDVSEVEYPDLLTGNVPLFSEKLKFALDETGIDNIDYFQVDLINEEDGKTVAKYYLGIVIGLIKCLKSGLTSSPAGRDILKNPVIDFSLVRGQKLFRLAESPLLIIVDSSVKDALSKINLQGVSLLRLKDYESF
ncbi:MAG: hypothetical protein JW982_16955 [Spirochaetes bacterium]|nr:hypothetical protein [Spirochaetota bacterium]